MNKPVINDDLLISGRPIEYVYSACHRIGVLCNLSFSFVSLPKARARFSVRSFSSPKTVLLESALSIERSVSAHREVVVLPNEIPPIRSAIYQQLANYLQW